MALFELTVIGFSSRRISASQSTDSEESYWLVMENPHARTAEEVIKYFDTDINYGLTDDQIEEYQEKYGPNGKNIFSMLSGIYIGSI